MLLPSLCTMQLLCGERGGQDVVWVVAQSPLLSCLARQSSSYIPIAIAPFSFGTVIVRCIGASSSSHLARILALLTCKPCLSTLSPVTECIHVQLTHPQPFMTATHLGYYRPSTFTQLLTHVMSISLPICCIGQGGTGRTRPVDKASAECVL